MPVIYVGIDVAKDTLDVVVRREHKNGPAKTYENSKKGIAKMIAALPKVATETLHACLEATGQYGDEVAETLHQRGYRVSVINPLRTKRYAQADLLRNQTDRVDAGVIAEFGEVKQPRVWVPPSPTQKALRALSRRYADLQSLLQMERNRQQAAKQLQSEVKTSLQTVIDTLKAELQTIKRLMAQYIKTDPELLRQKRLLVSIPGVGELTATRFLAELGDLRLFEDAKQLAAFLGLTPESKSSGTSVQTKPHLSKKGSAPVRHLLYMPAVVAKNHNPLVLAFCERLQARQKCDLAIIGAAMHKLVHLMFGVVHSGQAFDPDYLTKQAIPS